MGVPSLPFRCLAAAVVTAALVGLGPAPVRSDQVIVLGDGMALSYAGGSLDPISLEGAAEGVKILVSGKPVLAIARLRLTTSGALVDPDFMLVELAAQGIADPDGRPVTTQATGLDVPVAPLRSLAKSFSGTGRPGLATVMGMLDRTTLGALTLSGVDARHGPVAVKIGRISIKGVEDGLAKLILLQDCTYSDEAASIRGHLNWAQIEGFWPRKLAILAIFAEGLSVVSNDLDIGVAALKYLATVGKMKDGPIYPPDATLTATDVTVLPGRAPGAGVTAFFADHSEDGLRLQIAGRSKTEPDGDSLAASSSMSLAAQTGDAISYSVQMRTPIAGQSLLDAASIPGLDKTAPESAVKLTDKVELVGSEIAIRAGRLADRAIEAQARDSGLEPAAMRKQIVDRAAKLAGALWVDKASLRDAVTSFILESGTLRLLFNPDRPVPLASLQAADETTAASLWDTLNVSVSHSPP